MAHPPAPSGTPILPEWTCVLCPRRAQAEGAVWWGRGMLLARLTLRATCLQNPVTLDVVIIENRPLCSGAEIQPEQQTLGTKRNDSFVTLLQQADAFEPSHLPGVGG